MTGPARARAYAPGSVGNVGPGLDILGLALQGAGDEVLVEWSTELGVNVAESGDLALPSDPTRHTAAIAASAVLRLCGIHRGVTVSAKKGLPLSGGQGGSAASAVAGAVAANHLAGAGLDTNALLECALEAETAMSGRYADNVAASLFGGLVLVRSLSPIEVIRLPVPEHLKVVIVLPEQQMLTRDARAALPANVSREVALHQAAHVAAMVAAACLGDIELFGRSIDDRIAEPARAPLLPGFPGAKAAALRAGAYGCSISGSGPTAFAVVADASVGEAVRVAMINAYDAAGLHATGRVAQIDLIGAHILGT